MEHIASVFVQVIEKPERKAIIKRGRTAKEYWSYCQEVGCDVWGILISMKSLCGEPFKEEEYCQAIEAVQLAIERYDPSIIGYVWDETNPRIQLEPRGERGYIELKAIQSK